MKQQNTTKQESLNLFTHIPSGEIFSLVKTKPITLVPFFGVNRRNFGGSRQPSKITFARDYQKVQVG